MMAEERLKIDRDKNSLRLANGAVVKRVTATVQRQMTSIFTKSTIPYDPNSGDYESKWILSLVDDGKQTVGLILFDISTLQFNIGQFKDDSILTQFRTTISQMRPVEVVYDRDTLDQNM
jgi:DNA mismatch repair ATPase MutS